MLLASEEESSGSPHPSASEFVLFGGITSNSNRRHVKFLGSISIHLAVLGLLLLAAPKLILTGRAFLHDPTTLVAPVPPPPFPKRVLPRSSPVARTVAIPQRSLPPVPRPDKQQFPRPSLEEAPHLPTIPRPPHVPNLPEETPSIRPPVQTGTFASNLPPKASPMLPVSSGQIVGFDAAVTRGSQVQGVHQAATAGFDTASPQSRQALAGGNVQTGAFGQARGGQPGDAQVPGANVGVAGFDTGPALARLPLAEQAVRRSGFDELKSVNSPVKAAAPSASPVRAIEILDKPKPAYTEEARRRKIEGDVLLDVLFTAACEVRVLRVVQGLGYGLDENAISAAGHIRFNPASQAGSPIDQRVTIRVVFQITQ
jgi:TonB family protein